jgi:hypothetical protein
MTEFDAIGLIYELKAWVRDEGNHPIETEDGLPIFGIRREGDKLILETYE